MIEISFVVIGFNVEKYIERCLYSVLNQSYSDYEVIFIDDGSTDKTKVIVNKLAQRYEKLSYYRQSNQGANSARIHGVQKAQGKYIVFVDGDDWVHTRLAESLSFYTKASRQDIIIYNFSVFDSKGESKVNQNHKSGEYDRENYIKAILSEALTPYFWNRCYKKDFLIKAAYETIPRITMGDDLAANIRFAEYSPAVIAIPEVLYYYFNNGEGVSRKPTKKHLEILKAMEDVRKTLNRIDYNKYKIYFEFKYYKMFLYYVVRNRYEKTDIQDKIYYVWKQEKIDLKKNRLVSEDLKKRKFPEKVLIYAYHYKYNFGYFLASQYIKYLGRRAS
jgi:glycosyltransferase involved in cell wall biosynthesis